MSNRQPGRQLVRTRTTAGVGADSEARPATRCDASDHGLHPDQERKEASDVFRGGGTNDNGSRAPGDMLPATR